LVCLVILVCMHTHTSEITHHHSTHVGVDDVGVIADAADALVVGNGVGAAVGAHVMLQLCRTHITSHRFHASASTHLPPQSTPSSTPFCTPSVQVPTHLFVVPDTGSHTHTHSQLHIHQPFVVK
jgi:hypothetical protein